MSLIFVINRDGKRKVESPLLTLGEEGPSGHARIFMNVPLSGIDVEEDTVKARSDEPVKHFVPSVFEQDESVAEHLTKEAPAFDMGNNIMETGIKRRLSAQDGDRLEGSFLERQVYFILHVREGFDGCPVQSVAGLAAEVAGSVRFDCSVRDFPRRILQGMLCPGGMTLFSLPEIHDPGPPMSI